MGSNKSNINVSLIVRDNSQTILDSVRRQQFLKRKKSQSGFDYSYQSKKEVSGTLFFYLSSNSFASFLSQTSNLVHSSLHLSTWSPRFANRDMYLGSSSVLVLIGSHSLCNSFVVNQFLFSHQMEKIPPRNNESNMVEKNVLFIFY